MQENIARWRALPAEEKQRIRWEVIPTRAAQSMAFEGEPVDEEVLRKMHARDTLMSYAFLKAS
ncbi:MAG: hypothetical protein LBV54_06670 [Puniceicoccales bacterium]|nr:hypothetical protein [Puniceicoccales bacterium]